MTEAERTNGSKGVIVPLTVLATLITAASIIGMVACIATLPLGLTGA